MYALLAPVGASSKMSSEIGGSIIVSSAKANGECTEGRPASEERKTKGRCWGFFGGAHKKTY